MPAHTGSGSIALRGAVETMLRQRLTTSRLVAGFATDVHGAMIHTAQALAPVDSPLSRAVTTTRPAPSTGASPPATTLTSTA